jgi:hypothetical protein
VSADGLVIAGEGVDPSGRTQGWLAVLPEPAPRCSDGVDNDGDGLTDFPDDDGCASAQARSEIRADLDLDGAVSEADRAAFAAAFGLDGVDPGYLPEADFDGDGWITIVDFQQWLTAYEAHLASQALEEPGCGLAGIELLALVWAARAARRRRAR